jgi:quinol monooxygenase YgiN
MAINTVTVGLLVRVEARDGREDEVDAFLREALSLVQAEPATTAWFAVRFGRHEFGIVDFFPLDTGRDEHLDGPVARALMARAEVLFTRPPTIEKLTVLADRLPRSGAGGVGTVAKALLLTFAAKDGREADVEEFLRDARRLVEDEPKTIAWFAIRLESGPYGIFDVFPDNSGRLAHLAGHVPRELAKHALTLLGSVPDMSMLDVLATKLPS